LIKSVREKALLWLEAKWYQSTLTPWFWLLIPCAGLFAGVVLLRKQLYKFGIFRSYTFNVPIIVVGNITVGGTGKTPLVIHLARLLQAHGFRPGIISRGYGGRNHAPTQVYAKSDPSQVGDEPIVLAKRLDCPIVVGANRPKAVQRLLESESVTVVISDDGLQHYALNRTIEIAVVDGKRRFGNGWCLPIGPLRESSACLKTFDYIVSNTPDSFQNSVEFEMELRPKRVFNGRNPNLHCTLSDFSGKRVHAIAGIGCPDRFFELLRRMEIIVMAHPFADHYAFQPPDLLFDDDDPVIMTEKDFVKCQNFMKGHHWVLSVDAVVNPLLDLRLLTQLQEWTSG